MSVENLSITCRNFEVTESIKEAIGRHTQKLKKYLSADVKMNWVCWSDKKEHYCEVTIKDEITSLYSCAHSENLYKTLDLLSHRLKIQLNKRKEIVKERIHHRRQHGLMFSDLGFQSYPLFPS